MPKIRTVSHGCILAFVNSMRHAVRWLTPNAAACAKSIVAGMGKTFLADTLTYSASVPSRCSPRYLMEVHRTSSPRKQYSQRLQVTPGCSAQYERLPFSHPLWIVYSSGTTGLPKAMMQLQQLGCDEI